MSLNNHFLSKKQKEQKIEEEKEYVLFILQSEHQVKLARQQKQRQIKNALYSTNMLNRLENFADNPFSKEYITSMKIGAIPSNHPCFHQFRDRTKEAEIDQTGGITVKTFSVAKQRATTAEADFRSGHLETGQFNPHEPSKSHKHWLKVDDKSKETQPMRFGVRQRSENERLLNVQAKHHSQLDYSYKDQKMIHFPEWKSDLKDQWMDSERNLESNPCHYQGYQSDPPWAQFPIQLTDEDHTYVDGYEVVGDLSRKRFKNKEGNRTDFEATIKNDVLASNLNYSQSLRTMMQDKILNVKPDHDNFSAKIVHYKNALLQTKSIDHNVPYHHSNNFKGTSLKNLRPATQGKLFIKSVTHYNKILVPRIFAKIPVREASPPRSLHQTSDYQPLQMMKSKNLSKIQENAAFILVNDTSRGKRNSLKNVNSIRSALPYCRIDDTQAQKLVEKYFT